MSNHKAASMLSMRNRILRQAATARFMYVCCTPDSILPVFYLLQSAAEQAKEKLLGENITAEVKKVNITITFPSFSSGDSL